MRIKVHKIKFDLSFSLNYPTNQDLTQTKANFSFNNNKTMH